MGVEDVRSPSPLLLSRPTDLSRGSFEQARYTGLRYLSDSTSTTVLVPLSALRYLPSLEGICMGSRLFIPMAMLTKVLRSSKKDRGQSLLIAKNVYDWQDHSVSQVNMKG